MVSPSVWSGTFSVVGGPLSLVVLSDFPKVVDGDSLNTSSGVSGLGFIPLPFSAG